MEPVQQECYACHGLEREAQRGGRKPARLQEPPPVPDRFRASPVHLHETEGRRALAEHIRLQWRDRAQPKYVQGLARLPRREQPEEPGLHGIQAERPYVKAVSGAHYLLDCPAHLAEEEVMHAPVLEEKPVVYARRLRDRLLAGPGLYEREICAPQRLCRILELADGLRRHRGLPVWPSVCAPLLYEWEEGVVCLWGVFKSDSRDGVVNAFGKEVDLEPVSEDGRGHDYRL